MKKLKKIFIFISVVLCVFLVSVVPCFALQVEGGSTGSNPNVTFYSWTKDQLQIGFTRENDSDFNLFSPVSNNIVSREQGFTMVRTDKLLTTTYSDIERFNNISISTPTFAVSEDTVYHGIGPQFIGQTVSFRMVLDVSFTGYEIDPDAIVTLWPQFTAYFYTDPDNLNEKFYIYDRTTTYDSYYGSDFQIVIDYTFKITRSFQICGFFFNIPMSIFVNDKVADDKLQINLNFRISDIVLDQAIYDVQNGVENAIDKTIGRPGDPNYKYFDPDVYNDVDTLENFLRGESRYFYETKAFDFSNVNGILDTPKLEKTMYGLVYFIDKRFLGLSFVYPMLQISLVLGAFGFLFGLAQRFISSIRSNRTNFNFKERKR